MKSLPGEKLRFDWKIVTITVVSTLLLMVDYYHRLTPDKGIDRTVLYLLIPLIFIVFIFRERPGDYGFTIGEWRAGIPITLIAILLIAPILWWVARGDVMQGYYEQQAAG